MPRLPGGHQVTTRTRPKGSVAGESVGEGAEEVTRVRSAGAL